MIVPVTDDDLDWLRSLGLMVERDTDPARVRLGEVPIPFDAPPLPWSVIAACARDQERFLAEQWAEGLRNRERERAA